MLIRSALENRTGMVLINQRRPARASQALPLRWTCDQRLGMFFLANLSCPESVPDTSTVTFVHLHQNLVLTLIVVLIAFSLQSTIYIFFYQQLWTQLCLHYTMKKFFFFFFLSSNLHVNPKLTFFNVFKSEERHL